PGPPVSQYQRRVSGICATPSLAGTCAGMGFMGLASVWPCAFSIAPVPSVARPAASPMVRTNAPAARAQLHKWLLLIVARAPFNGQNTMANRQQAIVSEEDRAGRSSRRKTTTVPAVPIIQSRFVPTEGVTQRFKVQRFNVR